MAGFRRDMSYAILVFLGLWVMGSNSLSTCDFPAIYNFGSSTSDTGIYSALYRKFELPYGQTFFQKPAGRASDGRLIIDFIAEKLKLPYVNPALDILGSDYRHGASFAIGGATLLMPKQSSYGVPTILDMQIKNFIEFKQKTADIYAKGGAADRIKLPIQEEFSKALYMFEIGQNDLSKAFLINATAETVRSFLPSMVEKLDSAIRDLYGNGGRSFWIHNCNPIGCYSILQVDKANLPPSEFDENRCVKIQNVVAQEYNQMLKERIVKLRTELPEAAITYVDYYSATYELISNAKKEGFDIPTKICCGFYSKEIRVFCAAKTTLQNNTVVFGGACKNPESTIYWDGIHRTDAANRWVTNRIQDGSYSDPPVPITQACNRELDTSARPEL